MSHIKNCLIEALWIGDNFNKFCFNVLHVVKLHRNSEVCVQTALTVHVCRVDSQTTI